MAALEVVELMAKHTTARLTGFVEMIRGLANPKSGVRGGRYTRTPAIMAIPQMGLFVAASCKSRSSHGH